MGYASAKTSSFDRKTNFYSFSYYSVRRAIENTALSLNGKTTFVKLPLQKIICYNYLFT